ncbi:MAG: ABC transporter substrate-binding protein [Anaerolineales bacterium]|jgi:iron complex transport system substrate-binding protein
MVHRRLVLSLLLVAVMISSCGQVASPSTDEITATPDPEGASTGSPTATVPEPQAIEVVDALGRSLSFEKLPQRLVIAGRATALLTHSLYLFPSASDHLVALEERVQRNASFYSLVGLDYAQLELLEFNAGAEQIAPTQPDLVLMKTYMQETLGAPLTELGIPVAYLDLEMPEQFLRDIAFLGQLLGDPNRAEAIEAYYQGLLDRLAGELAVRDPGLDPRVLVMQYSDRGGEISFMVPSASWLQTTITELAGGEPVWLDAAAGGGWTIVGLEQIAAWDPDQVYVIYYPGDPAPILERLLADPLWQLLRAAQNGQVYGFAGDFLSWDQPDPRWVLGLFWMSTRIHPELTTSIDLAEVISDFYQQMYGMTPQVIETEILPMLSGYLEPLGQ